MRKLLAIIPLLAVLSLSAQDIFKKGFIVSSSGDTSKVILKEATEESLSKGVWVIQNDGKKALLTTATVQAFGFEEGSTFQAVTFKNPLNDSVATTLFAKCLLKGVYDLYTFMERGTRLFLVHTPDNTMHLLYNMYDNAHKNVIKKEDYRNKLIFFATSCERQREIAHRVSYLEKSMIIFMYDVNDCIKPGVFNQQIFYKKPKTVIIPYVYAGTMVLGDNKSEFTGQFILRFTLPSVSRASSINSGIIYYRNRQLIKSDLFADKVPSTTQVIGIPVTFQQTLTQGIVQPYIYVGIGLSYTTQTENDNLQDKGLQKDYGIDFIGGAGIDVFITRHLIARADFRYEVVTHYPTIGLAYKFK